MLYREYGKTDKQVSLIGVGTARLSGEKSDFSRNVEMIHRAIELGVNYFDTAPTYACGASEKILGAAFKETKGESIYVSSKSMLSSDPTADDVLRRVESALNTLHIGKIHFFHMWSVLTLDQYHKIIAPGGPYEGALKAKEQGLIDHICFSAHCSGEEIKQIVSDGYFEGVTLGFNAMNYQHRLEGLRFAASKGLGVAIMNPLAGGLIPQNPVYFEHLKSPNSTVAEGAIRFVAAHNEVSSILIGINSMQDLTQAIDTVSIRDTITAEQWHELADQLPVPAEPLCTMCDYCRGCPAGLAVSRLMSSYNEYILSGYSEKHFHEWRKMFLGVYPFQTISCLKCGRCERKCTQHLPIIHRIETLNSICEREAARQKALCNRYLPKDNHTITGIYGLSIEAETMIKAYQTFYGCVPPRVYFFDSNPAKWQTPVLDTGLMIHSPQEIRELGIQRILITAVKYEKEIRAFLQDYIEEGTEIYAL